MKHGHALAKRYGGKRKEGAYLAKPLAFPEVRSFSELFTSAGPWSYGVGRGPKGMRLSRGGREANIISGYLHMDGRHGFESMEVTPSPMVVDYITNNMLALGDRINFNIVFRDDGALVIAEHGKIIGSRWLAMIDPSSVPEVER